MKDLITFQQAQIEALQKELQETKDKLNQAKELLNEAVKAMEINNFEIVE
jgi:peptidoglycan hydrolase CwlO-like protein